MNGGRLIRFSSSFLGLIMMEVIKFQFCFGDVRRNWKALSSWEHFWASLVASEIWQDTGFSRYTLEGDDWGFAQGDPGKTNFGLAKNVLERLGFTMSMTYWGMHRFDAPPSVPSLNGLPRQ